MGYYEDVVYPQYSITTTTGSIKVPFCKVWTENDVSIPSNGSTASDVINVLSDYAISGDPLGIGSSNGWYIYDIFSGIFDEAKFDSSTIVFPNDTTNSSTTDIYGYNSAQLATIEYSGTDYVIIIRPHIKWASSYHELRLDLYLYDGAGNYIFIGYNPICHKDGRSNFSSSEISGFNSLLENSEVFILIRYDSKTTSPYVSITSATGKFTWGLKYGNYVNWGYSRNETEVYLPYSYEGDYIDPPSFPGDISSTGGGTGTFDLTGDAIDFQSLPTLSAVNSGFINVFSPTLSELGDLASYMWSSSFYTAIVKMFADPMDAILSLSIIPIEPQLGASVEVKIGGVSTGITMAQVLNQYISLDCGNILVSEFWGSALDYSPYTKIQIYLPYIGIRELNVDDIMGKSIRVVYNIDVLSGSLTSQIKCGNNVLYQYSGSCVTALPISGRDFSQIVKATISAAGAVGSLVATGGASSGISAAMAVSGVMTTANNVTNAKPRIERSGSIGSTAGLLGVQTPYLIIERPKQSLPNNYNKFVGYPSNITSLLSDLSGYTEISDIHLENITATDNEVNEIISLLKEGVIL